MRMLQAHATAYLHRVKDFPEFDSFMGRASLVEQSPESMWDQLKSFAGVSEAEREGASDG